MIYHTLKPKPCLITAISLKLTIRSIDLTKWLTELINPILERIRRYKVRIMEIDRIEKVHSIGYRLKDAKVTVNKDFKYDVAGMKIEGAQGDTDNVPRWVGKILADNGMGALDSPDMIAQLRQALIKEKMVGEYEISTLDPHFYIKLKQSLKDLKSTDFDMTESMMLELFRMRRGKLIKFADSIKLNSELYKKLTVEENVFYKTIYENSKEFERQIKGDQNEHGSS